MDFRKLITVFICLISCVFFMPQKGVAQDTIVLHDFINNTSIGFVKDELVLNDIDQQWFEQFDLLAPIIVSGMDDSIMAKINKRIAHIFEYQVEQDSFLLKLKKDMAMKLPVYLNTANPKDFKVLKNPSLTDSEFNLNFSNKSILTLICKFHYDGEYQYFDKGNKEEGLFEDTYFEIYYFNVLNGDEFHPADVFKVSAVPELNVMLGRLAKEKMVEMQRIFKAVESGLDDNDEISAINDDSIMDLKDFSVLSEGFAFPKVFSLAYYIPAFSKSTAQINGLQFLIRLELDSIKQFLNPEGPFASFLSFKMPIVTSAKKHDNPPFTHETKPLTPAVPFLDYAPFVNSSNINTVSIVKMDSTNNGKKELMKSGKLFKKLTYLQNGQLSNVQNFEKEGDVWSEGHFTFNKAGSLDEYKILYSDASANNYMQYLYDEQENLIFQSLLSYEWEQRLYQLYFPQFVLQELYEEGNPFENGSDKLELNALGNVQKTHSGLNYVYDGAQRVVKVFESKSPDNAILYNYDTQGRMVSTFLSSEEKLIEYQYDNRGNFYKEIHTISDEVSQTREVSFDNHNLPIKVSDTFYLTEGVFTNEYLFHYLYN
jgi:hypothetical protein